MSQIDGKTPKPFSTEYVLRKTVKYVLRSIDFSIDKTMQRIEEFAENREKSEEVFKTLALLQGLKAQVESFMSNNPQYFGE